MQQLVRMARFLTPTERTGESIPACLARELKGRAEVFPVSRPELQLSMPEVLKGHACRSGWGSRASALRTTYLNGWRRLLMRFPAGLPAILETPMETSCAESRPGAPPAGLREVSVDGF